MDPAAHQGEKLDLALDFAGPVLDLLDTALDIVSVPGIGLVPKGLSVVLENIKVARANTKVRKEFKAKAMTLASIIEDRLKTAATKVAEDKTGRALEGMSHSAQLLSSDVDVLKGVITRLVDRASKLEPRESRVRGAVKDFVYGSRNKEALSDMQSELDHAVRTFQIKSQIALRDGVEEIQRILKRAEEDGVLRELAHADAGYRAVDHLKSGFMEGTRKDLFGGIRQWAAGRLPPDAPKRFYALFGGAGMGKSAVAHRLCRCLNDGDYSSSSGLVVLGASFFFVRGGGDKASALLLPPTIAWQLAGCKSYPIIRNVIADSARSYIIHGKEQNLKDAFEGLLGPLSAVNASLGRDKRVFIVIDGLDECSDQRLLTEALTYLFTLVRALPWLYIFTASRPEPHITKAFSSSVATAIVHTQDLGEPSDSREDVEIYIRNMLLTVPLSPYSQLLNSERSNKDLLQHLLDRAGGLFIFARIACDFLLENQDASDSALQLILSPIDGGPVQSLDSLYLQILHFAFPPSTMHMFPDKHAHLLAFLHILVLKKNISRPGVLALLGHQLCQTPLIRNRLPAKAANTQISLTKEHIESIIQSLRSVLSIDAKGKVAPLHATLREFLLDPTRCTDLLYHVNEGEGHAGLASACLGIASSLRATTDILATLRDKDADVSNYGFYAIWFLGQHAGDAVWTESLNNDLTQLVCTFRLPLMARAVITMPDPSAVVNGHYVSLQKFCQKNTNGASIRSKSKRVSEASLADEYFKFMAYCLCVMNHVRRHPGEDWPDISGETVQKYFVELLQTGYGRDQAPVAEGWVADLIEVERYRSVVLALKAEIDQDERAKSLWYDFSITYHSF